MKIVNEKGKLFGLINIVDLLVLVAAVAVIGGLGWKLLGPRVTAAVTPTTQMTATMRLRGASPFLTKEIRENDQVGKKLVAGNDYVAATIENVTFEPYVVQVQCADGQIVNSIDPSKEDVLFTVAYEVPQGTAAPKIGTQEVRAGRTFILKTNDFEATVNIDSVAKGE